VNTASRMESHSLPGQVQVTEVAQKKLASRFEFEDRGFIQVLQYFLYFIFYLLFYIFFC
jgi:class 3 adenylate cyclase